MKCPYKIIKTIIKEEPKIITSTDFGECDKEKCIAWQFFPRWESSSQGEKRCARIEKGVQ